MTLDRLASDVERRIILSDSDSAVEELPAFTRNPSRWPSPLTTEEVKRADTTAAEAAGTKNYRPNCLNARLSYWPAATIFNNALEDHDLFDIDTSVFVLVQKPGKLTELLMNIRPIDLLSVRKTLSLVVVSSTTPKVYEYPSPSQLGHRRGRCTADVVFGYRWLRAKAQRQR